MKRLARWIAAVVLFAFAIALVAASRRIHDQSSIDEARPADVIIVLGAAEYAGRPSPVLRLRLEHALSLYRQGLAPRVMTTGGAGGDPRFTEGEVGRDYLVRQGVPSEAIVVERESESTAQATTAAAEIMRRMKLTSCIVVSDGYHIFRVKKMLEFRGLKVYGSPRIAGNSDPWRRTWLYTRQAAAYLWWQATVNIPATFR